MSDTNDPALCPFCADKALVVADNKTAQVVLSNPRKTIGHVLVAPKRHIEIPWELTLEEQQDIFALIFEVEKKLIGKLGDGCDVRQNYRPFMQQSRLKLNHIHFHVIPRYFEDYIYKVAEIYDTDLFTDLDPTEASEVTKLLRS
jgi:diadenosine tetraphosphate (Ap4A) HIT family hydrolase